MTVCAHPNATPTLLSSTFDDEDLDSNRDHTAAATLFACPSCGASWIDRTVIAYLFDGILGAQPDRVEHRYEIDAATAERVRAAVGTRTLRASSLQRA